MAPSHDRTPVLLQGDDIDAWLTARLGREGLRPAAESALRKWPVTKCMNRTGEGDDDPSIVEKINAA